MGRHWVKAPAEVTMLLRRAQSHYHCLSPPHLHILCLSHPEPEGLLGNTATAGELGRCCGSAGDCPSCLLVTKAACWPTTDTATL